MKKWIPAIGMITVMVIVLCADVVYGSKVEPYAYTSFGPGAFVTEYATEVELPAGVDVATAPAQEESGIATGDQLHTANASGTASGDAGVLGVARNEAAAAEDESVDGALAMSGNDAPTVTIPDGPVALSAGEALTAASTAAQEDNRRDEANGSRTGGNASSGSGNGAAADGEGRSADDGETAGQTRPRPADPDDPSQEDGPVQIAVNRVQVDPDNFDYVKVYYTVDGLTDGQQILSSQLYDGDTVLAWFADTDTDGSAYFYAPREEVYGAEDLKIRVGILSADEKVGSVTSEQYRSVVPAKPEAAVPQIKLGDGDPTNPYYSAMIWETTKAGDHFELILSGAYEGVTDATLYFWDRQLTGYLVSRPGVGCVYRFDVPAGMVLYHGMPIDFVINGTVIDSEGEPHDTTVTFRDIVESASDPNGEKMPPEYRAMIDADGYYTGPRYDYDGNPIETPAPQQDETAGDPVQEDPVTEPLPVPGEDPDPNAEQTSETDVAATEDDEEKDELKEVPVIVPTEAAVTETAGRREEPPVAEESAAAGEITEAGAKRETPPAAEED